LPPIHHQAADDVVLADERYGQYRSVTQADEDVAQATVVGARRRDVGYLDRLTGHRQPPGRSVARQETRPVTQGVAVQRPR